MNISAPFIHRPVATTLLTVAVAIAGGLRSWCSRYLHCHRWTFRRFQSMLAYLEPAPTLWRPRLPRRSNANSAISLV